MKKIGLTIGTLLILWGTLTPLGVAQAAAITVNAGCSLVDAITSANTNAAVGGCAAGNPGLDTITLTQDVDLTVVNNGAGSSANGLPIITENVVIRSSAIGVTRSIKRSYIVGTPSFRIMEIGTTTDAPSVTIKGILIANGLIAGLPIVAGGCLYMRQGNLTLLNSSFEDCYARGDSSAGAGGGAKGGAIYAANGTVSLSNTTLSLNSVIGGESTLSGFSGGTAEGGGIYGTNIGLTLTDSTIASNFAIGGDGVSTAGLGKGGGVVLYNSTGTMTGSSVLANASSGGAASSGGSALAMAGGILVEAATLTLDSTELRDNVANGQDSTSGLGGYAYGGALYSNASTLDFVNSPITENQATAGSGNTGSMNGLARGGGLFLRDTTATLDSSTVEINTATGANALGGGIFIDHTSIVAAPVVISNSVLDFNNAIATFGSANGGALYQDGDSVTLENSSINDNNADYGGGLYQENGTLTLTTSTFSSNNATHGGAIAVDGSVFDSHTVDLINTTISGNTADTDGGGLYITGAPGAPNLTTVNLYSTTVTNNTNGGVYLEHGFTDPVLVSTNTIIGEQASGADCTVSGGVVLTSNGGNLESGTSCSFTAATDQQSVPDMGLDGMGSYNNGPLSHALLPDSPAIDAGESSVCDTEAGGVDQRGLARFYDGNGDNAFDCDSGAVEYQGLLANPGFETVLTVATDWTRTASGGGDVRVRTDEAPSGQYSFRFRANNALENISQSVPVSGASGDVITLTLMLATNNVTIGDSMTVTLAATNAGAAVNDQVCTFPFDAADFVGSPAPCVLTTAGAYDMISVTIGWDNASTGSIWLDSVSLTK